MLKRVALLVTLALVLVLPALATGLAAFGKQVRRDYQHAGLDVKGTILNAGGSRAAGVRVIVSVRTWYGGGGATYGTTTNGSGRYSVHIPRGPSRLITVSAQNTTREIRELVSPHVWVNVASHGHREMLFRGGVSVDRHATVPTVLLQDRTPTGWQTFGAVNPSPRSHLYRFVYHNAPSGAVGFRFAFRAVTLQNNAWMPGISAPETAMIH